MLGWREGRLARHVYKRPHAALGDPKRSLLSDHLGSAADHGSAMRFQDQFEAEWLPAAHSEAFYSLPPHGLKRTGRAILPRANAN